MKNLHWWEWYLNHLNDIRGQNICLSLLHPTLSELQQFLRGLSQCELGPPTFLPLAHEQFARKIGMTIEQNCRFLRTIVDILLLQLVDDFDFDFATHLDLDEELPLSFLLPT